MQTIQFMQQCKLQQLGTSPDTRRNLCISAHYTAHLHALPSARRFADKTFKRAAMSGREGKGREGESDAATGGGGYCKGTSSTRLEGHDLLPSQAEPACSLVAIC